MAPFDFVRMTESVRETDENLGAFVKRARIAADIVPARRKVRTHGTVVLQTLIDCTLDLAGARNLAEERSSPVAHPEKLFDRDDIALLPVGRGGQMVARRPCGNRCVSHAKNLPFLKISTLHFLPACDGRGKPRLH